LLNQEKNMDEFPEIPGCKIVSILGEGGMATVYLGVQEKLNRKVAIKVLETSRLKNKIIAARFEREAKTAANLCHSNIIQIFDTDKSGDSHYFVMEYLEESLKDRMKRSPQGKIDPKVALGIVEEIMKALDYAHFKGIYHRDIKPANIMFREDDTPVLVDFGIARVFDFQDDLTDKGQIMGSVAYMSPEQCQASQDVDGRSDVYSMGAVLFEMLTGKKPYKGDSPTAVIIRHIKDPVPRLPQDLSRYQRVIDHMMVKDREKRLSSGAQLVQMLDKIPAVELSPPPEPEHSSPKPTEVLPSPAPANPPPREFQYRKPTEDEDKEPLFNKYFNLLDEKLRGVITGKLGSSVGKIKKNLPVQKKLIPGVLLLVIVAISLLIFLPSSKSILKPPVSSTSVDNFLTQKSLYYIDLNHVLELYKKRDIESLEKALIMINGLKQTAPDPELNPLEKKINHRIGELEKEFERYLTAALDYFNKKNLSKAEENISLAKQIKTTERLKELEDVIERKRERSKKKRVEKDKILTDD